mgnify:CR=1 FL=1
MLFHNLKKTALIVMLMGALMGITSLHAQNKTISGTVSDAQGEVVIGASVMAADNNLLGTVTDIDGNVYNTVLIGNQCWMKENLRTTRYANAVEISDVRSPEEFQVGTSVDYGKYYKFTVFSVKQGGIA